MFAHLPVSLSKVPELAVLVLHHPDVDGHIAEGGPAAAAGRIVVVVGGGCGRGFRAAGQRRPAGGSLHGLLHRCVTALVSLQPLN